jgi:manganese/zinc/iron transport system ATP- binding protein
MSKATPALLVNQLTVNYDRTPVLWDISLEIPQGVIVGIIGPNGAGKSTFLKTALGLLKPITGRVEFFGFPLEVSRSRVAYVPQRESVDWDFPITVFDLVLMGRYGQLGLFRHPREADKEAAWKTLELVGMEKFAERQIDQLSGGQQQRVFIARALMQEADIYLMDEPFAGVDLTTEKAMVDLFRKLRDTGKTLLIVHHDLASVESYFDWVIMLNLRLVACGKTEEMFSGLNLESCYGKNHIIFDEMTRRIKEKSLGLTR